MNRYRYKEPWNEQGPILKQIVRGGWLATTGCETERRIGVIGATREEALANLVAASKRWDEIAALP